MNTHDDYKELVSRIALLNRLIHEHNRECDPEEAVPLHIRQTAEELTKLAERLASNPNPHTHAQP